MGDFRHRAIVVTTDFDGPEFREAHAAASASWRIPSSSTAS